MPDAMIVPLAVATFLSVAVAASHRLLPPALATRSTAIGVVVVVAAGVPTVWMTGIGYLAHAPVVGGWLDSCAESLGEHHGISPWLGLPALVLSVVGLIRATGRLRTYLAVRQAEGGIHIVEHDEMFAFTVPGKGGRIVLSDALYDRLSADERTVVLAHEAAHARHRHDRYLIAAELAAALLSPLRVLVRRLQFSIERWADEEAAAACGDRELVFRTLGRVALYSSQTAPSLAFAGLGVPARMGALKSPPVPEPRSRARAVLWLAISLTGVFAAFQLHHLVEMLLAYCPG